MMADGCSKRFNSAIPFFAINTCLTIFIPPAVEPAEAPKNMSKKKTADRRLPPEFLEEIYGGSARRQAVGFSINNIGYVGTGESSAGLTKDFYKYDPLTNSWNQINDFWRQHYNEKQKYSMK